MQMIFQDPYSSLSPRMPVGEIIGEAVREHNIVPKNQYRSNILKVMRDCGLQPQYFYRYPTSSPAASGRESALPARWRSIRSSSSATNRSARWTFRFRRRLLTS
jgi:ABC-type antimicrobial peptide transport system ATPase subunit